MSIEYVQCPRRWKAYAFHKQQYIESGGPTSCHYERLLWHGTSAANVITIAHQGTQTTSLDCCQKASYSGWGEPKWYVFSPTCLGFLRQFGKRQAYGDGIYFSSSSRYSSNRAFSTPDHKGHQRMFLARVLVGEYHQGKENEKEKNKQGREGTLTNHHPILGHEGLKIPHNKPRNKNVQYESVVDSLHYPSIFVIFKDDQAYAEFVVVFKERTRPLLLPLSQPQSSWQSAPTNQSSCILG